MIWILALFAVGYIGIVAQTVRWALSHRDKSLEEL